jgi:hypothetical protein
MGWVVSAASANVNKLAIPARARIKNIAQVVLLKGMS